MQEQLIYVAAIQSKEQIKAEINLSMVEKHALLSKVDQEIKQAHHQVSVTVANHLAQRTGLDANFLTRLVHNVFGFEKVLVNLEPIKFQLYFHLKEMNRLRETLKVLEENGLVEIDHIFTNEDEKRFLINSFLPKVNRHLANGCFVNPLDNTQMAKHEFYRHYFQIIHLTDKYLDLVAEALDQQACEASANDDDCEQYQAVA